MNKWRSFIDAREFVRSLKLKNEKEWRKFRKDNMTNDIPTNPNRTYTNEWKGIGDWIGTYRIADQNKAFLSYQEAKTWATLSGISNQKEWRIATKNKLIPYSIPTNPHNTYKNEWTTWGDFLGSGFIHYKFRNWRSYEDAQKWASNNKIYTREDWDYAAKMKTIPSDIPVLPYRVYKKWNGWPSFFCRDVKGGSSIIEHIIRHELAKFIAIEENQRIVLNKRVDIIIKDKNVVIEYDGYHWHKDTIEQDKKTNSLFLNNGWEIIRIREYPLKKNSSADLIIKGNSPIVNKGHF